jgi:hypothetical protein
MAEKKKSAHTTATLKELSLSELQKIAKSFGLVTAGKRVAELIKAILAAQEGAAKGRKKVDKKADKKSSKSKPANEEDDGDTDEDDGDTDEDDEDPKKGKKLTLESLDKRIAALEALASKSTKAKPVKDNPEEEEEEDDDDPEEEEEGSEEEEEGSEEEEEEEDDPEEEDGSEDLEIDADELAEADLDGLKEIAAKINEHEGATVIKFAKVTKANPLRDAIRTYLNEKADVESDDDDDDDDEPKAKRKTKKETAPSWLKPKAKIKAKYEKKWYDVVVREVGDGEATVYFPHDKTEADVPFSDLKKA